MRSGVLQGCVLFLLKNLDCLCPSICQQATYVRSVVSVMESVEKYQHKPFTQLMLKLISSCTDYPYNRRRRPYNDRACRKYICATGCVASEQIRVELPLLSPRSPRLGVLILVVAPPSFWEFDCRNLLRAPAQDARFQVSTTLSRRQ